MTHAGVRTPPSRACWRLCLPGLFLLALFGLAACGISPTPSPTPAPPTATPLPTITPTPLPAILRLTYARFDAPDGSFSVQAPTEWTLSQGPGQFRFQEDAESQTGFAIYLQTPPAGIDPAAYLGGVISTTIAGPQVLNPDAFQLLRAADTLDGRHRVEVIGQFETDAALQHLLAEWWLQDGSIAGLALSGPAERWDDLAPLWTLLQQSLVIGKPAGAEMAASSTVETAYIHPSGVLSLTLPLAWEVTEEGEQTVLFSDAGGLAQYSITATDMGQAPTPKDLADTLKGIVGELAKDESYQQLADEQLSLHERLLRFDLLTPEEGLYRTELRAFTSGNTLITTSFSAPPHDWELYAPAYDFFRATMLLSEPPLDEAIQDADPLAGIEVGETLFYRAGGGNVWVSAPIHNHRTRNLGDLTAAVQLFDADNNLLGAESWRLGQRVVPAGGTTYLTMRLGADVAAPEKVGYALVQVVDAEDTAESAYQPWEYVGGRAETDDEGNVVLKATLRNPSDQVRRNIYVTGLVYDAAGKLVFARADSQRLPYAVPTGADVDVEITVWGPFSGLASFDVVGEVPR